MTIPHGSMNDLCVVRPSGGPQPFRRNASLAVRDGELVVTDGRGRVHRFTLDKTKGGVAHFCAYSVGMYHGSGQEYGSLDARYQALIRTWPILWNEEEIRHLAEVADLIFHDSQADAPRGDRPEMVELKGAEGSGRIALFIVLGFCLVIWALVAVLRGVF
jgi:hypothetical protein